MEAGVLVIVSDEPVTSTEVWQVMPTHDVWMEKLARYVFDRMGGKGKLVYLSGIDGAPASDQRDEGFYRALKDYPNIELLTQAFGFWDPARSQQTMADVLAAYPQIDGVVAQDGQCLATIRAFQAANRKLPVVNGDGFRPMMEYWAENVDTLLCRTDRLTLTRDAPSAEEASIIGMAPWDRVVAAAGDLLEPQEGLYPERFRVRAFPTHEQLAQMAPEEL